LKAAGLPTAATPRTVLIEQRPSGHDIPDPPHVFTTCGALSRRASRRTRSQHAHQSWTRSTPHAPRAPTNTNTTTVEEKVSDEAQVREKERTQRPEDANQPRSRGRGARGFLWRGRRGRGRGTLITSAQLRKSGRNNRGNHAVDGAGPGAGSVWRRRRQVLAVLRTETTDVAILMDGTGELSRSCGSRKGWLQRSTPVMRKDA
jgi:hypothetical protein